MSNHQNHSSNLDMRLHEARSLLIAINTEETVTYLKEDRLMAALSVIDRLIEGAQKDHEQLVSAIHGGEVSA